MKLYCKQHGLDIQEIDDEASYNANKQHLEQFVQRSPEDLAKQYGKVLELMDKEISLSERYGVIPESEEQLLLLFKSVVHIVTRSLVLLKADLKPFEKQVKFYGRHIEITAQITETATIIQHLEERGVKMQFVGSSMVHQRVWQWLPSLGFRKIS